MNRQELLKKVSHTVYQLIWEKVAKRQLRFFSKSGDYQVERHYSTHYVKPPKREQDQFKSVSGGSNQQQGSDEA